MIKVIPSIPDIVKTFIATSSDNYKVKYHEWANVINKTEVYLGSRWCPKHILTIKGPNCDSDKTAVYIFSKSHYEFGVKLAEYLQTELNNPDIYVFTKYTPSVDYSSI